MKKLFILLTLAALLLSGCAFTAKKPVNRIPRETTTPAVGSGEAVIPEEGDIIIDIS